MYGKLLKVKAGGGGSKEDDEEDEEDDGGREEGVGGAEAVGRVNSESVERFYRSHELTPYQPTDLVGTDIDVISSSLNISLQLFSVPFKLIVSLVALYILLGWSAFVALGSIIAFAPVSRIVSKRYGKVRRQRSDFDADCCADLDFSISSSSASKGPRANHAGHGQAHNRCRRTRRRHSNSQDVQLGRVVQGQDLRGSAD